MAKKSKADDQDDATSDGSIAVNDAWTGMLAISLLALIIGAAFLAYDYFQYDEFKGTVPNLTGASPKAPGKVAPPPVIEKKDEVKDKDKGEEKKDDKKDARLRIQALPIVVASISDRAMLPEMAIRSRLSNEYFVLHGQ